MPHPTPRHSSDHDDGFLRGPPSAMQAPDIDTLDQVNARFLRQLRLTRIAEPITEIPELGAGSFLNESPARSPLAPWDMESLMSGDTKSSKDKNKGDGARDGGSDDDGSGQETPAIAFEELTEQDIDARPRAPARGHGALLSTRLFHARHRGRVARLMQ